MRKITSIKVPSGIRYVSDIKEIHENQELLKNCIFDKSVTGCGATSYFLSCKDEKYIITVPYINLVESKKQDNRFSKNCIFVSSIHNSADSVLSCQDKNIVCTYDQLENIVKYIDPKEYNLVIDEYQDLFKHHSFRGTIINYIINKFDQFKSFCFVSATCLYDEIEQLHDINIVRLDWEDANQINIVSSKVIGSIRNKILELVKVTQESDNNIHFFCNSVSLIKNIVDTKYNIFSDDNTRVVYSKSNKKHIKKVKNSLITSDIKKYNFYTSTCFEGCDIFDEKGIIVFLIDSNCEWFRTSILDTIMIKQCCGRIRNYSYDKVYCYYTHNFNSKFDDNKFLDEITKKRINSKSLVNRCNNQSYFEDAICIFEHNKKDLFVTYNKISKQFEFDCLADELEQYEYKLYKKYLSNNFNVFETNYLKVINKKTITAPTDNTIRYLLDKEYFKQYYEKNIDKIKEKYKDNKEKLKEKYKEKQEDGTGYIKKENSLKDILFRIINNTVTEQDKDILGVFKIEDRTVSGFKAISWIIDTRKDEFLNYCEKINWFGPNIKQWIKTRLKRRLDSERTSEIKTINKIESRFKGLLTVGKRYEFQEIKQIAEKNQVLVSDLLDHYDFLESTDERTEMNLVDGELTVKTLKLKFFTIQREKQ